MPNRPAMHIPDSRAQFAHLLSRPAILFCILILSITALEKRTLYVHSASPPCYLATIPVPGTAMSILSGKRGKSANGERYRWPTGKPKARDLTHRIPKHHKTWKNTGQDLSRSLIIWGGVLVSLGLLVFSALIIAVSANAVVIVLTALLAAGLLALLWFLLIKWLRRLR